ncbi:MAG: DUF1800 domain-containing protein [Ktedonobacteraceae bacterium]|nr:DUF1800 domain-containing protein [Ktedonobacteraceae bacterium]
MDIHEQPTMPWGTGDAGGAGGEQPTVPVVPAGSGNAASAAGSAQGGRVTRKLHGISRRKLALGLAGAGVALAAGAIGVEQLIQHNMAAPGALTGNAQIGHLLRRAGFGATPDELASYSALGYQGAVDRLLNYQQVPDDEMENRLKTLNLDLNKPQDGQRWWLLRMAWTKRPLLEKMTLFWHGHFTSGFSKVGGKNFMRMIVQNQFLRAHAFDTFDNLLLGITADPAMLAYLDLTKSRKNAPNENYARELMELFTLGLGHYTQQDVSNAAAALTGWHVRPFETSARYYPQDHNTLSKTFLGQTGNFDYKDIVRILANHPATPWFIARKLFTFFAYENPSNDDLKPLVDAYNKSNHNMGEVMRALLLSPQFSSAKAYRSRIKSPVEFTVGAYRALGVQGGDASLPGLTTVMGQTVFNPPNVAGWPGDKVSAAWLNSGAWMTRLNYIDLLLIGSRTKTYSYKPLDLQGIINANHIDSPEHFVDYFASFLLDGNFDPARRAQLVTYFTTPDQSKAQITLTSGKSYPLGRVRGTLYLLLASPEYQLN